MQRLRREGIAPFRGRRSRRRMASAPFRSTAAVGRARPLYGSILASDTPGAWRSRCVSAMIQGRYGAETTSSHDPKSTVAPEACADRAACAASDVLPIPGSPATSATFRPARVLERRIELFQFDGPTEEREESSGRGGEEPARHRHSSFVFERRPPDLHHWYRIGQSFQFELADRCQLDGRVSPDHGAHNVGREYLPALRRRAQPRRFDHRVAEVVAVLLGRFAGRYADPHRERQFAANVVTFDALLHRDRARQGPTRRAERNHQTIAEILHLGAAGRCDRAPKHAEMRLPQLVRNPGRHTRRELGRTDEIGEQQRDPDRRSLSHDVAPALQLRLQPTKNSRLLLESPPGLPGDFVPAGPSAGPRIPRPRCFRTPAPRRSQRTPGDAFVRSFGLRSSVFGLGSWVGVAGGGRVAGHHLVSVMATWLTGNSTVRSAPARSRLSSFRSCGVRPEPDHPDRELLGAHRALQTRNRVAAVVARPAL